MAFSITKCQTKSLTTEVGSATPTLDSSFAVVDLQTDITPIMDLQYRYVDLRDEPFSGDVQLSDRTVHDIVVDCPDMYSDDPYSPVVKSKCELHLFFPNEHSNDADGKPLAREFVIKLSIKDNCAVYFHEYSQQMNHGRASPIIEYELDNELLGNEMLHYFIEVKKPSTGKKTFYMKSRNSVHVSEAKISGGKWTISKKTGSWNPQTSMTLSKYIEVDSAKVWYANSVNNEVKAPYLIFDRTKNIWMYIGSDNIIEYMYLDANTTSMNFVQHNEYASWHM